MNHFYSPHTGEHIETDNPADWMESTTTPPPAYDRAAAGCFFRNGAWEVVPAGPESRPDPQAQIDAIERQTLMNRATREFLIALAEKEAAAAGYTVEQLYAANHGYRAVKDVESKIVALRALIV